MSHFLILLATFNGERFLDEQIQSIKDQTVDQVSILVSDDGSTDRTLSILRRWQKIWDKGDFTVVKGPKKGFEENFRSLIIKAEPSYDLYAFCDQDDVWMAEKLADASECLGQFGADTYAMLCGRTKLINENGSTVGYSPEMRVEPNFKNALVQSIAGANTMVFNCKTLKLLKTVSANASFVSHDWWTYLWVTGAGGTVVYEGVPKILYRQHESNIIGSNSGLSSRLVRVRKILDGVFRRWTDRNLDGLSLSSSYLTEQNRALVRNIVRARQRSSLRYFFFLVQNKIHRQTTLGNISLLVAAIFGKI
jgi:glycosyltransferase involved in cell wall biosynthesis